MNKSKIRDPRNRFPNSFKLLPVCFENVLSILPTFVVVFGIELNEKQRIKPIFEEIGEIIHLEWVQFNELCAARIKYSTVALALKAAETLNFLMLGSTFLHVVHDFCLFESLGPIVSVLLPPNLEIQDLKLKFQSFACALSKTDCWNLIFYNSAQFNACLESFDALKIKLDVWNYFFKTKLRSFVHSRIESFFAPKTIRKPKSFDKLPSFKRKDWEPTCARIDAVTRGSSSQISPLTRADYRWIELNSIQRQRKAFFKGRSKRVKFACSGIHNWGLFTLERIEKDDFVIEYVGEIIRRKVADVREKEYELEGIGSSYLFRLDEDRVVDATKVGNYARFINHSCDPNCVARIVNYEGEKKIVIYAAETLKIGDEITYDYKFDLEENKLPCHCASKNCRGYLN